MRDARLIAATSSAISRPAGAAPRRRRASGLHATRPAPGRSSATPRARTGTRRRAASTPIAKRGETWACWTSASATSVGIRRGRRQGAGQEDRDKAEGQPEARSPASARRSRTGRAPDDGRPELLSGEEHVERADGDRQQTDEPASQEHVDRQAGRGGQQSHEDGEDDRGGHGVERDEKRDEEHERGEQLRHRVHALQRRAVGGGRDVTRGRFQPKRAIGECVLEGAVVGRDADAASVVAQRRQEVDELGPGPPVLAERRLVEDEQARRCREGRRHGQPPLLAAGQRERVRLREVG